LNKEIYTEEDVSEIHPRFFCLSNWKYLWAVSPVYTSPMQNEVARWVLYNKYKIRPEGAIYFISIYYAGLSARKQISFTEPKALPWASIY